MSVYLHIPFCRSKCFYCGFYSVVSDHLRAEYIRALCREIGIRKDYLSTSVQETLYLGGGTPSYLKPDELERIVGELEKTYIFSSQAERTIEMNPEDAGREKMQVLKELGFNRLSIGVQSFDDGVLKRINRSHSAADALRAIEWGEQAGFDNMGMDLIIGLPGQSTQQIIRDLDTISKLPLSHLSVYILSVDSNSVFERLQQKGKFQPDEDDVLAEKYLLVADYLKAAGFEHYEISNFARNGKYAVHNTAYWQQKHYIGFGASAHSYDGNSRQWNVANIKTYIEGLDHDVLNFEREELSKKDKFNESIMTNLRTMWGIGIENLEKEYPGFWAEVEPRLTSYLSGGYAEKDEGVLKLTPRGWLISDRIFSDLFV